MKKLIMLIMALVICLVSTIASPVAASGEMRVSVQLSKPFSVDRSNDSGHNIPINSVIHHRDDGRTEVYYPGNTMVLDIGESEATEIPTPNGLRPASHVYQVPSGAFVEQVDDNITKVYKDVNKQTCLLTVINDNGKKTTSAIPEYNGWVEYTHDWSVSSLGYFYARWTVPSDPPDPSSDVVNFLFNAIEPSSGNGILQPVLEWNNRGVEEWTGAAWYGTSGGDYYYSTPIDADAGDTIYGTMYSFWANSLIPVTWTIVFKNNTTGQSTSINTQLPTTNLAVFCALEGYELDDDDDVPGDTTFTNMAFKTSFTGSTVDITWDDWIASGTGLTGLDVDIWSDSIIALKTAN